MNIYSYSLPILLLSLIITFTPFGEVFSQEKELHINSSSSLNFNVKGQEEKSVSSLDQGKLKSTENENFTVLGRYAEGSPNSVEAIDSLMIFTHGANLTITRLNDQGIPEEQGQVILPGRISDLDISDSLAFAAMGLSGVSIVDFSDPNKPKTISRISTSNILSGNEIRDLKVSGNHLYVTGGYSGLVIINISDPSNPKLASRVSHVEKFYEFRDLLLKDDHVYVFSKSDKFDGILAINVSDPSNPTEISRISIPDESVNNLILFNNYIYGSTLDSGLYVVDISDPDVIQVVNNIDNEIAISAFKGNYGYSKKGEIVDVTNPETPQVIKSFEIPNSDIAIIEKRAFLASNSLVTLDISEPLNPTKTHTITTGGPTYRTISILNDNIYSEEGTVVNFADRSELQQISSFNPGEITFYIEAKDNYVYTSPRLEALRIFDVSNPQAPQKIGAFKLDQDEANTGVHISNNLAYIASGDKMRILDITTPSSPEQRGIYEPNSGVIRDVYTSGPYAYIANQRTRGIGTPGSPGSDLIIVDISEPTNPQEISIVNPGGTSDNVFVGERYAFVAGGGALRILDISDPTNPQKLSEIGPFGPFGAYQIDNLTVSNGLVYTETGLGGLAIIDVSDPRNPEVIGRYDTIGNANDVELNNDEIFITSSREGLYILDFKGDDNIPSPTISSIAPNVVTGSKDKQEIVINGGRLKPESSIKLKNISSGEVFSNIKFSLESESQLTINHALGLKSSTWSIQVINPGLNSSKEHYFEVKAPGWKETPTPPANLNATVTSKVIKLEWTPSTSDYLKETILYRSTSPEQKLSTELTKLKADATSFTDSTAKTGKRYYYSLKSRNLANNDSELSNIASTFIQPASFSYHLTQAFGEAARSTDYKLVGLPGRQQSALADLLPGEPGTGWTAYRQSPTGDSLVSYREDPEGFTFGPGRGFWVLANQPLVDSSSVVAVELSEQGTYSIPLHSGWNIISNPT
ncbi:hypothetical protein NC796_12440, partial [Aliifodinibius sp. S!AR15-10]|uniref:hypothetical protein n=1 Tax=Aliifodinibius sp. S!AR15-10 TaxID=2950437 RepID=UPI00285532F9